MNWETFAAVVGAIATLGTAFLGFIKYLDKKRQNTTQHQIDEAADSIKSEQKKQIDSVKEENAQQTARIDKVIQKVDENEKDRLRATVMDFADKLRNHFIVNKADFEHIHHMYDKYHDELHGNSYVESEYEFIKQKEQEFYNNNEHKGKDK